jgi:hypothetical protein
MRYLFLIGVILFSVSCKKNPPLDPLFGPYHFTQEFKDYNIFQNNSKWIYQRENSQDKDTVLQEVTQFEIVDGISSCYCNYEYYIARQKSSFFNDISIIIGRVGKFIPSQDYDYAEMLYEGMMNNLTVTFQTPMEVGGTNEIIINEFITYKAFYPAYTIEGKEYKDVKVFEVNISRADKRLPRRTYYAKNVGIIRRELWNGQVWNLIHHEAKQ